MSGDYADYGAIKDAIVTVLQGLTARHVSRHLIDYDRRAEADQASGVYTLLNGPREGYDYEYRPGELPKVKFFIYGEQRLAEDADPDAIDDVEDEMMREIEMLATDAIVEEPELLAPLTLQSITPSAQLVFPHAQVLAVLIFGVDR